MDAELIEKVARAIYVAAGGFDVEWDELSPYAKEHYHDEARAAIAAMSATPKADTKPHVKVGAVAHVDHGKAALKDAIASIAATPQAAQVPEAIARLRDGLWVFSSNDDVFQSEEFDSEQDAIAGALSYGYDDDDHIYVGQVKLLNVRRMIGKRVEDLLDWVGEDAGEEVGESADGWPCLSSERIAELQQMVADFILTHSPAPFYMVENVRSYSNAEAEAMLAAAQAQEPIQGKD